MKITVVHGDTVIKISGKKSLKKTKKAVKDIFNALPSEIPQEEEPKNQIGFTLSTYTEKAEGLDEL